MVASPARQAKSIIKVTKARRMKAVRRNSIDRLRAIAASSSIGVADWLSLNPQYLELAERVAIRAIRRLRRKLERKLNRENRRENRESR